MYPSQLMKTATHVVIFPTLNSAVVCDDLHTAAMLTIDHRAGNVLEACKRAGAKPFGRQRVERMLAASNLDPETVLFFPAKQWPHVKTEKLQEVAKAPEAEVAKALTYDNQFVNKDFTADDLPGRVRTGVKNATVYFPWQTVNRPENHDFGRMQDQYHRIRDILAHYGLKLEFVGSEFKGGGQRASFVSYAGPKDSPLFVWQKYEGDVAGGGQNRCYVNGQEWHTSTLMIANQEKLDEIFGEAMILRAWVNS